MALIRTHMYVSGRVQGVFFRNNTRSRALELGLTGWVRNLPDGRVEVVVEGEEKQVDKLIRWCGTGPPRAAVTNLEVKREPYTGEFESFRVRM